MKLSGHQLDGFNAALKSGNDAKAHLELQTACAVADGVVPLAAAPLLAAFGDNYPIIAVLDKPNGWYLVAHPNGPAIANSGFDLLASLAHEHEDVPESIRRDAVWHLMGWAAKQPTWPKAANDGAMPRRKTERKHEQH